MDHAAQSEDLTRVSDEFVLSAKSLSEMTVDHMNDLFRANHKKTLVPPDMDKRCLLWNEVGRQLQLEFDASAFQMIQHANGSASRLVQLLVNHFEGFQDFVAREGKERNELWLLKRAQICVGDWNAALQLNLSDQHVLTTFADYRVPQLLRHYNVLEHSNELADKIDAMQEMPAGGDEECSIRAATVTAVEWIVEELNRTKNDDQDDNPRQCWTAVETDWYLWQVGETMQQQNLLKPHHRVRTIYY